jgi:hypothetical protein
VRISDNAKEATGFSLGGEIPPTSTENLVVTCLHAVRIPSDINTRARGRLYCRHSEVTLLH